jgi:cation transport ATPase
LYVDEWAAFEEFGIIVLLEKRSVTMKTQRITFPINDLSRGGDGVRIIERALAQTSGFVHVYVNSSIEMAYIEYDPALSDPDRLVKAVERAGFRAGKPGLR